MPDEPGWYPDPKNEAPFRFYDGRKWTKSVADQQPQAARVDDGPVEGGLMGLLEHERVNEPMPEVVRPTTGYVPLGDHIPLTAPTWGPLPDEIAEGTPPPPAPAPPAPSAPQADWPPPAAPAPPAPAPPAAAPAPPPAPAPAPPTP